MVKNAIFNHPRMVLRKCPSCHEVVGAESEVCPRCGVNFRGAMIRKIIIRLLGATMVVWLVGHFLLKKI